LLPGPRRGGQCHGAPFGSLADAGAPGKDFADACLVRMSELTDACKIGTVDRADFRVYRRHGRAVIPCESPKV